MYVCVVDWNYIHVGSYVRRTHALHTYVHSLTQLQLQMAECPLRSSRLWNGLFLHIYIVTACLTPLAAKYRIQTTTDNHNRVHYVYPFSHCPFWNHGNIWFWYQISCFCQNYEKEVLNTLSMDLLCWLHQMDIHRCVVVVRHKYC